MVEINNKTKQKVDEEFVEKVVAFFLKKNRLKKDVSVAIIGDAEMRRLNLRYRGKDKTTDILSFPENDDPQFLGELILSYAQLRRQAPLYSRSFDEELAFILFHGLLHLSGFEDETDAGVEAMEREGGKLTKDFFKKLDQ